MKIELECCGFSPHALKVFTDIATKISILRNKIVIESSNERISHLTIKSRSIYTSRLCYLNIVNPIYYLYQYKLKNDDIYFYDDDFIWADIDIDSNLDSNLKIKLEKCTKHNNGSNFAEYAINALEYKKIRICYHNMPSKQIYRYKLTNIASQLFYSILIMCLGVLILINNQDDIILYLCALMILLIVSGIKVYKYLSSKSTKDI